MTAEIDRIAAIRDPEEQGRAVAELLRTLDVAKRKAVALRRDVVLALRAADRSHAEVAEIILLDRGTAAQIAAGKQTGRKRRSPPKQPDES